jgi:hypothetical protein
VNPIRAWSRFFFEPVSARPLAVFRIIYGLMMIVYLALMVDEFDYWYTGSGFLRGIEVREAAGPLRFSPLQYVEDSLTPRLVLAGTFAAALGLTLGWRTRWMNFALYLGLLTLYHRNIASSGGTDAVPLILAFHLMLCPSGAAYSLDARRRSGMADRNVGPTGMADRNVGPTIVPWGLRLLQVQLCVIYFQSCAVKCQGPTWSNGTAVHYVLFNDEFNYFALGWLGGYPLLVNLMTHGALLIEFALAFWLWFRPTRRWAILGGVLLHAGIRPMLNVPGFGEFMCATYLTFLDADEIAALLRALDPRGWLARLGLRRGGFGWLRAPGHPMRLAAWQQLEFAFGPAEVPGGAESIGKP